MATVREITTLFNFKPNLGGLKKANISIDKLKTGLKRIGIAALAAGGTLFAIAKTTANFGDNIAKTAQKIGLSTDALQELTFASKLSGVEQATLEGGIKRLSRGMLEASQGVATYADTYEDLGIKVEDGSGKLKTSDVIIEEIADKLAGMEDVTRKTAIAQELFGRAGAELIPLLNSGSKGIQKMRKEARSLGIVMSSKATKASEKFNDELLRTTEVVLALKRQIGLALLPIIQKLTTAFRGWVIQNRELIRQRLNKFLEAMAFGLGFIIGSLILLVKGFGKFIEALKDGDTPARALVASLLALAAISGFTKLIAGIKAIGAALLFVGSNKKIILLLAGVAALVAVGDFIRKETKTTAESLGENIDFLNKSVKTLEGKKKKLELKIKTSPSEFLEKSRQARLADFVKDIEKFNKRIIILGEQQRSFQKKGDGISTLGGATTSIGSPPSQPPAGDRIVNIREIKMTSNGDKDPKKTVEEFAATFDKVIRRTLADSPKRVNPGS